MRRDAQGIRLELKSPLLAFSASPNAERSGFDRDRSSAVIVVYPAHIDSYRGCASGFDSRYDDPENRYYKSLMLKSMIFSGLGSKDFVDCDQIKYRDPHDIGFEDARRMYKTLSSIEGKMEKWRDSDYRDLPFYQYMIKGFAKAIGAKEAWIWDSPHTGRTVTLDQAIEWYEQAYRRLWLDCHLLVGDFSGGLENCILTGWTDAPKDYDGFGTETIEVKPNTNKRKVKILSHNYTWQVNRYRSGLHQLTDVNLYTEEEQNVPA